MPNEELRVYSELGAQHFISDVSPAPTSLPGTSEPHSARCPILAQNLLGALYLSPMPKIFFVLLASLFLIMCASVKKHTLDTLPERQLIFKFGGGFTGEYKSYLLLPNGQLFYRRQVISPLPFREYQGISTKEAKDFFSTYDKQNFALLGYDNPGNMTYTITSIDGADTTHITWGGTNIDPSEELRSYWRRAMQAVEGKKELPQTE